MKWILITITLLFVTGCEIEPSKFDNINKFKEHTQYFLDHKGNCFAVIGTRKTGTLATTGIGLSLVPRNNCP